MKHKFIAKRYWNSILTAMGESEDLANIYDDIINLSIGDPDIHTDKGVINGAFLDAMNGHTHYTEPLGDIELKREIIKFFDRMYNFEFKPNECMITTGATHAMWLTLETILDEGDEVIIPEPYFTPYPQQILLARGKPVFLDSYEHEGFEINIERLQGLITNRTKAIIINTPNNPTGSCLNKDQLENISKIAIENDLIVVADDIYTAYSYESLFIPICTISGMKERTITIRSFSKDYAMTGWRVGCVIAPEAIINTMKDINENNVYTAPSISQRAAIHALSEGENIQKIIIEEFKKRVYYAYERINNIQFLSVKPPKGSIYLFVNIKKSGLTSKEFCKKLLNEQHILTIPGDAFGKSGEGYIRIALTVGVDKLKEAFDRIEKLI